MEKYLKRINLKKSLIGVILVIIFWEYISILILIVLGSLSKIYQKFFRSPIGIDLMFAVTIYAGIKFGKSMGIIVGILTYLVFLLMISAFHPLDFLILTSLAFSGYFSGVMGYNFTYISSIFLITVINLVLIVLTIRFFAFPPIMSLTYFISNLIFNFFLLNLMYNTIL